MTDLVRGEVVWSPPAEVVDRSRIGEFLRWLTVERGRTFRSYAELWAWSVDDLEGFWDALAAWSGMRWHARPSRVLGDGDRSMPSRWFPDGTLNYAEHALAFAGVEPDAVAVVARSQTRERSQLTWGELADQVARCRAGLVRLGVRSGDRVVAFTPNIPETLIAFLAAASLGAVWSSCPPEFGPRAVVDRFAQVEPTVLLAVDGYRYGTKVIDRRSDVDTIRAALPTVRHVVPIRYLGTGDDGWTGLLAEHTPLDVDAVPSDHPLYVLYSSGTTGLPKAIVHGHGGITAEHLKVLALHQDLGPGDRFMWFSTTGWMMWNYLVSGLLVGAAIVLYDGDPGHPDLSALWRLAADERVDVLGASAPFLMACHKSGLAPGRELDLSRLPRRRVDGRAPPSRRIPLGARCGGRPRAGHVDQRGHRCVHRVRRHGASPAGARGRNLLSPARLRRARVRRVGRRMPSGRAGRDGDHRADALDAGVLVG